MSTDNQPTRVRSCSVGGDVYEHTDRPAEHRPPCQEPPTHRFRAPGMAEGWWSYRCAKHVGWLDQNFVSVEPLTGSADGSGDRP